MIIFRLLILFILPLIFFGYAFVKDLNPSGTRVASYDFTKDSPMISRLFPADRLEGINEGGQLVLREPVYFTTRLPQNYDRAVVELEYESYEQELVQLGLQQSGEDQWAYAFQPVENQALDNLTWDKSESGELTLWQREKQFDSVNDFLQNYFDLDVAAYNFDLLKRFVISNYQESETATVIDRLLRGDLAIYTYIGQEDLDWTFEFLDFNRTEGEDVVEVVVTNWAGQEVFAKTIPDDGFTSNLAPASDKRTFNLNIAQLPEGVYKIEWRAPSDLFVSKITTKQNKLAFIDRLYLANSREYADGIADINTDPTELLTNVGTLSLFTAHPLGLQTVKVDNQEVEVNKTHEQIFTGTEAGLSKITSPFNDLLIRGDGLFYFDQSHIFNPEVVKLKNFDPTTNVDFVIAKYSSPEKLGQGVKKVKTTFNLDSAAKNNQQIRFMISAPNLQDQGNLLRIKKIEVTLEKPPLRSLDDLFNLVIQKIQNVF